MEFTSNDARLGAWPRALPNERIQQELQALNERFLALLNTLAAQCADDVPAANEVAAGRLLGLRTAIVARIGALAPAARHGLAGCPYALAGVGLHDVEFWELACKRQIPPRYERLEIDAPSLQQVQAAREFLFLALAFAWHLTHTAPVAARWMLGAGEYSLSLLRATPFDALPQLTHRCPGLLHARLADQRRFWEDLVAAAESGTRQARFAAVSLGLQLSAAAGAARPPTTPGGDATRS